MRVVVLADSRENEAYLKVGVGIQCLVSSSLMHIIWFVRNFNGPQQMSHLHVRFVISQLVTIYGLFVMLW